MNSQPNNKSTLFLTIFSLVAMVLLIGAIYSRAAEYQLEYLDTWKYIVENECIHGITLDNLKCIFANTYFSNWQPITLFSFMLEHSLYGVRGAGYHVTNILIHIANCGLLCLFLYKTVIYMRSHQPTTRNPVILYGALVSAMVFAVHPQHVESVVWVAERKGLLSFLFSVIALLYYHRVRTSRSKPARIFYFVSVIACMLAMMSKPNAIAVPVFMILMDRFVYDKSLFLCNGLTGEVRFLIRRFLRLSPFVGLSAISLFVTIGAQEKAIVTLDELSVSQRIFQTLYGLGFYIEKFLVPKGLYPYYSRPDYLINTDTLIYTVYVFGFLAITIFSIYLALKKSTLPLFIWAGYIVLNLPTIGLLQVGSQVTADRYAYLSTLPFYILLAIGFSALLESRYKKLYLFLIIPVFILVIESKKQVLIWSDDFFMWTYVKDLSPGKKNIRAEYALGDLCMRLGMPEKAIYYYNEATTNPEYIIVESYFNYAKAFFQEGRFEEGMAVLTFITKTPFSDPKDKVRAVQLIEEWSGKLPDFQKESQEFRSEN